MVLLIRDYKNDISYYLYQKDKVTNIKLAKAPKGEFIFNNKLLKAYISLVNQRDFSDKLFSNQKDWINKIYVTDYKNIDSLIKEIKKPTFLICWNLQPIHTKLKVKVEWKILIDRSYNYIISFIDYPHVIPINLSMILMESFPSVHTEYEFDHTNLEDIVKEYNIFRFKYELANKLSIPINMILFNNINELIYCYLKGLEKSTENKERAIINRYIKGSYKNIMHYDFVNFYPNILLREKDTPAKIRGFIEAIMSISNDNELIAVYCKRLLNQLWGKYIFNTSLGIKTVKKGIKLKTDADKKIINNGYKIIAGNTDSAFYISEEGKGSLVEIEHAQIKSYDFMHIVATNKYYLINKGSVKFIGLIQKTFSSKLIDIYTELALKKNKLTNEQMIKHIDSLKDSDLYHYNVRTFETFYNINEKERLKEIFTD